MESQDQRKDSKIDLNDIPQHNTFIFKQKERQIVFSSEFDSGNCGKVVQKSQMEYDIYIAPDCSSVDSTNNDKATSKSWFYFSVQGFAKNQYVKFNIQRVHMLYALYQAQADQSYRPVFKVNDGCWERLTTQADIIMKDNQIILQFYYRFPEEDNYRVYFAWSYPYPYFKNITYMEELQEKYGNDPDFYFNKEILTYSPCLRLVHLITISSHDDKTDQNESYIHESLFPERELDDEKRSVKFKNKKPIVLITARVHPGETPASYALEGIIEFLTNKTDFRAYLLRKFFVFMIVPMLNPDGVYAGYYRKDVYNQNLNRFYKIAQHVKQPSIFAIRQLVEYLNLEKRLFFYLDLHAHAGKKGQFLYGNACEDIIMQAENQLYAKLIELNCKHFEYNQCNFSKKQMSAKDRFEEMTKEGCGRVFVFNTTNIIHSYTLECGFHQANEIKILSEPVNSDKIFDGMGMVNCQIDENSNPIYQEEFQFFTPQIFRNTGQACLISILDIFDKNPYSRIFNSGYKNMENLRKEIAIECSRTDRFRREQYSYSKARKINELIQDEFFNNIKKKKVFQFDEDFKKKMQDFQFIKDSFLTKHVFQDETIGSNQKDNYQRKKTQKITYLSSGSKETGIYTNNYNNITNFNLNNFQFQNLIPNQQQTNQNREVFLKSQHTTIIKMNSENILEDTINNNNLENNSRFLQKKNSLNGQQTCQIFENENNNFQEKQQVAVQINFQLKQQQQNNNNLSNMQNQEILNLNREINFNRYGNGNSSSTKKNRQGNNLKIGGSNNKSNSKQQDNNCSIFQNNDFIDNQEEFISQDSINFISENALISNFDYTNNKTYIYNRNVLISPSLHNNGEQPITQQSIQSSISNQVNEQSLENAIKTRNQQKLLQQKQNFKKQQQSQIQQNNQNQDADNKIFGKYEKNLQKITAFQREIENIFNDQILNINLVQFKPKNSQQSNPLQQQSENQNQYKTNQNGVNLRGSNNEIQTRDQVYRLNTNSNQVEQQSQSGCNRKQRISSIQHPQKNSYSNQYALEEYSNLISNEISSKNTHKLPSISFRQKNKLNKDKNRSSRIEAKSLLQYRTSQRHSSFYLAKNNKIDQVQQQLFQQPLQKQESNIQQ